MEVSLVALLVLGLVASVHAQVSTIHCHAICDCLRTEDGLALVCSNRNLNALPDFQLLPGYSPSEITELYLNDNHIPTLGRNNFEGTPNLRIFSAARNNITRWRRDTFDGLDRLEFLSMEDNPIDDIEPDDTLDFPNLKEFIMTNHKVTNIPRGLFPESIEVIRVDDGLLNEMPYLGYLPKLKTITAKNNKIPNLRRNWFSGISKPKAGVFLLDLNGNPVEDLDPEWLRPKNQLPICRPENPADMKSSNSLYWFEIRLGNGLFDNFCEITYWVNFLSMRSVYPNFMDMESTASDNMASGESLLGFLRGRCRDNWVCSVDPMPSSAIRPAMTTFGVLAIAFAALLAFVARW